MTRLPHHAVPTGGIDGAKDRADVVWIFYAVEDDEQRRRGRSRLDDLAQRIIARIVDLGDDPLMHAVARQPIDHFGTGTLNRHTSLSRDPQRVLEAPIAPRTNAKSSHSSCAKRLE